MPAVPAADPLDNAVWHALTGPLAPFADGRGSARCFPADVAPFAALPDDPGAADWEALRELVGAGGVTALFRSPLEAPGGWQVVMRMPCTQMVCPVPPGHAPRVAPLDLGRDDRDAMLGLTAATRPGPFVSRTHELGHFLGVRAGGRLIAMAGERLRIRGATEISAVCTDPAHRRRGLAAGLVTALCARIHARGELPFLHVAEDNPGARKVYEGLGFTTRARIDALVLRIAD